MPYRGQQSVACYSKAQACLRVNRSPTWACNDEWKTKYPIKSTERVTIYSGGYKTTCGPVLKNIDDYDNRNLRFL